MESSQLEMERVYSTVIQHRNALAISRWQAAMTSKVRYDTGDKMKVFAYAHNGNIAIAVAHNRGHAVKMLAQELEKRGITLDKSHPVNEISTDELEVKKGKIHILHTNDGGDQLTPDTDESLLNDTDQKFFIDGLRGRGELAEIGEPLTVDHTHRMTKAGKIERVKFK